MKTTSCKGWSALFLAGVLAGVAGPALRAQPIGWKFSSFDGNTCGFNAVNPVTLTYDPTQDATGDGGGSCLITTDYSQPGFFDINIDDVTCCLCQLAVALQLSNYTSVEFDVKWDTNSTVPLSYFNSNFGAGTAGISIDANNDYSGAGICSSNIIIPAAASYGWVHISEPVNPALSNVSFAGITFQKTFPAYPSGGTAAFWLDNLYLAGPTKATQPVASTNSAGNFSFSFVAIRNATYTIQRSTNLVNWTNLATCYPSGGAPATGALLTYTDTNGAAGTACYRIRIP